MNDLLEDIGLTKGEIAVYTSLLELGMTTVGPLTKHANISSSKIYYVLDRLMDKGLVSHIVQEGARHFEAAHPKRILEYVQEKREKIEEQEKQVEKILPQLELQRQLHKRHANAQVYKGNKGARTAFRDVLQELCAGEEMLICGAFSFDEEFQGIVRRFHNERVRSKIKLRVMVNKEATHIADMFRTFKHTKIKYLPSRIVTPAIFITYADKTLISLPNSRTFIQLTSNEAADAFRSYFEALWNEKTTANEGKNAITELCEAVLNEKEDLYLLGANASILKTHKTYYEKWNKRREECGIQRYMLSTRKLRKSSFGKDNSTEERYLPKEFESPLVIWIFGDVVAHVLWDQLIVTTTRNKHVANDYKKYFKTLWKQAS